MTDYEKKTDFIVAQLLTNAGLDFTMNGSQIEEIYEALKTSSKRGTGKSGFPKFVAQSGEFVIVIEDKADQTKQAKYISQFCTSGQLKHLAHDNYSNPQQFLFIKNI